MEKARQLQLDLIEIAPQANPPVARLANFQKFRYEENKKERGAKRAHDGGLKELWLSPRIDEHDLRIRLNRTEEFLKKGHKVKLTVKFKGREMTHQELGHRVLEEALALLGDTVAVEREPKMEGRKLSMIVGKSKGAKLENGPQNENQKINLEEN